MYKKISFLTLVISFSTLVSAQIEFVRIKGDSLSLKSNGEKILASIPCKYIVDCDTIVFELQERCMQCLERDWIRSISVYKKSEVPDKYMLYKGYDLIIFEPFSNTRSNFWALKTKPCLPNK